MKRLAAVILLGACTGCGPAQQGLDAKIVAAAMTEGRAYEKLEHLTDRIGPRLSGSEGLEQAIRWTADEFRRDGLERVWTEPVMVPHWVRGVETCRIVSPIERAMATTALGMSVPTPPSGVTGEVVEVAGFDELKALGARVAGKIDVSNKAPVRHGGKADDKRRPHDSLGAGAQ